MGATRAARLLARATLAGDSQPRCGARFELLDAFSRRLGLRLYNKIFAGLSEPERADRPSDQTAYEWKAGDHVASCTSRRGRASS